MVKEQLKRKEIDDRYKWNLNDLIKNKKELNSILLYLNKSLKELKKYKGKILSNSETLLKFLNLNESMDIALFKLYSYASLKHDEDTKIPENQSLKIKVENIDKEISENLSFIIPEIIKGGKTIIKKYIKENKDLKMYEFYFKNIFRSESHVLNEREEEIVSQAINAFNTGEEVFDNLNDTDVKLGIIKDEIGSEIRLTQSNYIKFVQSKNPSVRKSAFDTLYDYYKNINNTLAASLRGNRSHPHSYIILF
jgi:oligoendopeptidase F